ncbi:MAG: 2-phospho-L-lactate transferase [Thermomicrobiales bacterium]
MSLAQAGKTVTMLAGGVGGAKLAQGFARLLPDPRLQIIVNTADDFHLYGLAISPDIDTVTYTLAGMANPVQGWGIADDTRHTLDAIARLGGESWFLLGDRDFATHILRTQRLQRGDALSRITGDFAHALGIGPRILPMTDQPVATVLETPEGSLEFQDYFVARRQADDVLGVRFAGIESATPAPGVLDALVQADIVVIAPSNPIVSVGPILAVPGVRDALASANGVRIAVSPIVGGKALKGPADRMLATLGHEVSALGVARIYAGLIDVLAIDTVDADQAPSIEALGIRTIVTNTIMGGPEDRERLAAEVLDRVLDGVGMRS